MTTSVVPPRAGRREWIGLAVLCLPTMLTQLDINVVILALPRISADLESSSIQQLWITDIYGFMIAGFLVTMGTLGDRIGHRKVLLTGAAGFIVASLLAAYSNSTPMLLISRALLGIAAATVMPSVLALITKMFKDPKQMGAAFGIWGSFIMLGIMFGPTIGGLMLNSFWWGSVFLLGVPVMLLLLAIGPRFLPESSNPQAGRLDLISVALSLAAILPFIYGLKLLARSGWHVVPVIAVVVGLAIGVVFLARQRRLADPLLDLRLFRNPIITAVLMLVLVVAFILASTGLLVTLHMQLVKGISPLKVGLWLLIPAIGMLIGNSIGPAIASKVRPAYVIATGMVIGTLGALVLTQTDTGTGVTTIVIGMTLVFLGNSPTGTVGSFLLMTSAPPEKAGSAASVSSTSGELGIALGIAVMGSVANAIYQRGVDVPGGVPANVAGPARESITRALAAAGELPGSLGAQLLHSARAAFTDALHTVMVVNAVLFLLLAVFVLVRLRQAQPMAPGMPGMPPGGEGAPGQPQAPGESVQSMN